MSQETLEIAKKQNVTNNGFFIKRANIEILSDSGDEHVMGSVKYEAPSKYLISVKSIMGLEVVRIFIDNDTVLINDRINRKQYYGSPENMQKKYGIAISFLPLLFGDYVTEDRRKSYSVKNLDGKLNVNCSLDGVNIRYVIDCKKRKTVSAFYESNLDSRKMKLMYDKFLKTGDILFPGKVIIVDAEHNISIKISIKKIEYMWNGKIEFIPGKKYESIRLL